MTSLQAIYDEESVTGEDASLTAQRISARLDLTEEQYAVLSPLLRQFCLGRDRVRVRSIERQALPGPAIPEGAPSRPSEYRALLHECFFVPGVGTVAWGEATVEHHRARIAMLSKQRAGIDSTIERHEWAIERITTNGVTCLYEVQD